MVQRSKNSNSWVTTDEGVFIGDYHIVDGYIMSGTHIDDWYVLTED